MTTKPEWRHGESATSPNKVQAAERSYQRSVFWSRLMLAAFFSVGAITFIWAVPWFPYGTSVEDYNSRVGMLVLLALSAAVFAFCAVRLRDKTRRVESTYVTMSTVHDSLTDMRRRQYFYDRLLIECDRAKQRGGTFAVVVLRTVSDENRSSEATPVHLVVAALQPLAKEYDWLAPIGVQEVAMFVPGVGRSDGAAFAEDLRGRTEAELAVPGTQLVAGWACYGDPLTEAGDILGHGRRLAGRSDAESLLA